MKTTSRTSQFKRDVKRIKQWGKDLDKLKKIQALVTRKRFWRGYATLAAHTKDDRLPKARDKK